MEQLGFRESFIEGSFLAELDKKQKKQWKELSIEDKRHFIKLYKEIFKFNKEKFYQDLEHIFQERGILGEEKTPEQIQHDKLIDFFRTQGIPNPTETTIEAFKFQQIFANFDNFYHVMGQFTFNIEKQAQFNYYMSQQKQNFIHIAQRDKIIKQNDEIIELLKKIADK